MEFEKVIKERFSTRKFKDEKISDELIEKILEAGNIAPTAKNLQPQKIYVMKSKEGLDIIDKVSPCRYNAPLSMVICADKVNSFTKENYSSYEMDASIVATHMILEATNLGINSLWVRMFDEKQIKEELKLDENIEPVCILNFGYKTEECQPSRLHDQRKNISEIVEYR